ncbi:MAG: BMP family ABC transporter substrate-binding protein [Candidatus Cloacimonadota bacterium]|nr:MAG: BMP family ABC transporter substrate-binding protein [Candidatus Cloacimonadota bacterium]PIE78465.1 MAG: BMP family ABC transporter substrate-binding protein [Candidatus Delongbacteria bacterium]
MKKISSFFVVLVLSAFLFVGCEKSAENKKSEKTKQEKSTKVKVGFIYVGPVGDGGWTYAQDIARKKLEKERGVETIYRESVPEGPEVKDVVRNMVDQGCNLIIAGSFGYIDYIEEASKEFPNIKFSHCSGYKQTENMANHFGRMYEPRYLSGIVAGMKTKTDNIGYVAAFEIPEVIRGINAFTLGVKSVNPKAKVHVRWTHTWYDPAKEKEAAKALLDEKCDIIAQHQDTAGPQQAAEERGVWSIGYNSDMKFMAPKAYMTAPIWDWSSYYISQVDAIKNGTWKTHSFWGGMKDGVVTLAPLTENAPEGAKSKVDEIKDKIISGELFVFQGPIKDQSGKLRVKENVKMTDKELKEINWFVEGVVGDLKSN